MLIGGNTIGTVKYEIGNGVLESTGVSAFANCQVCNFFSIRAFNNYICYDCEVTLPLGCNKNRSCIFRNPVLVDGIYTNLKFLL